MLYKVLLAPWAQRPENLRSAVSQCTCECLWPWKKRFSIFLPSQCPSLLFKKVSNEGRKQNNIFSYVNSVAGYENLHRSSGCQVDLSVLRNISQSEWEGVSGTMALLCTSACAQRVHLLRRKKVGWHICLLQMLAKKHALTAILMLMFWCRFNQDQTIYKGLRLLWSSWTWWEQATEVPCLQTHIATIM